MESEVAGQAESGTARKKSKRFAIEVIEMYKGLVEKREYVLAKQVLRSGTSIGANLAEAESAVSKKDFLNKVYIALKECCETKYWLELLVETGYIEEDMYEKLYRDCEELRRMLSATTRTVQRQLENKS